MGSGGAGIMGEGQCVSELKETLTLEGNLIPFRLCGVL